MVIDLEESAWRQVLAVLSGGPWATVNPLIMEIGRQMQTAAAPLSPAKLQDAQRGNSDDRSH